LPNPDADAEHIAREAAEAQAVMLVTLAEFGHLVATVRQEAPVREVLLVDPLAEALGPEPYALFLQRWTFAVGPLAEEPVTAGRALTALLRDAPYDPPPTTITAQDLAAILFTSGTSGLPKGVGLTHANLVANAMQTRHWFPDLRYGGETFLAAIPLRHSYGMTTAMNLPIAVAATIVLLPLIDLRLLLEHIRTTRPTIFPAVPSLYAAINHAPNVREYGLGSIKACLSGAAPLPVEVQETFEKLTRGRLVEGYGLTEASPVTHANPLVGTRKPGSIGLPLPNTDARIVDPDTGADLPPGQVGELVVRGPQVMQGYVTGSAAVGDTRLHDGWLFTGDLALMDTDGYFHLIGRKSEVITLGERRIYPRDIEEILYEHSKVQEAAVVAVPDGAGGWRIKAFVVPRPGTAPSKDELLNLCRRRLDPEAVPWDIEFRSELPKNFLGKVLRRLLVEPV
jgi:long-chain acyl-CoA synthetase